MSKIGGQEPPFRFAHRQFPSQPFAAASARAFVADWLSSTGVDCPDAVAVVGELASNAVRYGRSQFEVRIRRDTTAVRIEVRDESSRAPAMGPLSLESPGGRGLHIVEAYSNAWGTEFVPGGGKSVWAELRIPDLGVPVDGRSP
jgi:anti-sigma regulatory factor (Ser/Thr protein kinase)